MAIPAQGCVIQWSTWPYASPSTVQEVQSIEVRSEIERIDFRGDSYFFPGGTITLTGFSNSVLNSSKLLDWGTLKITVPTAGGSLVLHEGYAQLSSCDVRATINQAVLFAFQIRLWGAFNTVGTLE